MSENSDKQWGFINVVIKKLASKKMRGISQQALTLVSVSFPRRTLLYGLISELVSMRRVIDK